LLFDGFAGGLVCGIFLGVRESRASDTAQSEHRQTANNGMDEIHVGLPFSAVFVSQGHRLPFRIVQVVQEAWAVSMKKSFGCSSKF
jgi:hypothetical protein